MKQICRNILGVVLGMKIGVESFILYSVYCILYSKEKGVGWVASYRPINENMSARGRLSPFDVCRLMGQTA